jgi:hypothetical protein
MKEYASRNAILKEMGYASYKAYLASPLWKSIRARVLRRFGGKCRGCGRRANQVHHHHYPLEVLSGRSIEGLSAVCGNCHEGIEFHQEVKLDLRHANKRLKSQVKEGRAETVAIKEHKDFRDKLRHIKKTLKGKFRDIALAEAYRERSASIR